MPGDVITDHEFMPDPFGERDSCRAKDFGDRSRDCGYPERLHQQPAPEPSFVEATEDLQSVLRKANLKGEGLKLDQGKLPWHLLPWQPVEDVVRVLQHGAAKYEEWNWLKVPRAHERYFSAALRHLVAWFGGEKVDRDSGLPHLAHAACCILFLMHFDWAEAQKP